MPGSRGATGQSGRKRPTWASDGDATSNGSPVLTLSDRAEGPATRRRIQCVESHPHPNVEGIADDGGNEDHEHQSPAAKVLTKIYR